MKKLARAILTILVLFVCRLQADTNWTTGHHEIYNDDTYGEIWMYNDCTLNIFGGTIAQLTVFDTTLTNFYDGHISALLVRENSTVNIYGGQLSQLAAIDNSLANLFAYDVMHTTTGGYYSFGQVTGKYYLNDSSFSFDLMNSESYSHITVVPEPTTFLLFGLSVFVLKKK